MLNAELETFYMKFNLNSLLLMETKCLHDIYKKHLTYSDTPVVYTYGCYLRVYICREGPN
jgi:hypothetical protein